MAETFTLAGSYVTSGQTPTGGSGALSMDPTLGGIISETMSLKAKTIEDVLITSDAVIPVPFGGVVNAHVVMLKATAKVRARLTSADGTTQSVPVDGALVLISSSGPITAIDLQRVSGAAALTCRVFLGEKN